MEKKTICRQACNILLTSFSKYLFMLFIIAKHLKNSLLIFFKQWEDILISNDKSYFINLVAFSLV